MTDVIGSRVQLAVSVKRNGDNDQGPKLERVGNLPFSGRSKTVLAFSYPQHANFVHVVMSYPCKVGVVM